MLEVYTTLMQLSSSSHTEYCRISGRESKILGMWKVNGVRLRELRQKKLMTQADLSVASKVAAHTISALETGIQEARPGTIKKLAEALGVEPAELMAQ
jgi:DNA-binding XRE family transcriptional regulator